MFDAKQLLNMVLGGAQGGQGLGNLQSVAGAILGQATQGVREAAGRVEQSTGAGAKLQDIVGQLSGGQSTGDMLARVQQTIGQNPMATGAVLGSLGSLLLGTKTGRGVTTDAAKLGGLVLIGGLAYKAYQNWQQGKPLVEAGQQPVAEAPKALGYGAGVTDEQQAAIVLLKAMIAAAAADGTVDENERKAILGAMEKGGLEGEAAAFLQQEFAHPASASDLVALATSPEQALQIYAAARLAIDPDTPAEKGFLADLARGLSIEPGLVAHVDAAARGAMVSS